MWKMCLELGMKWPRDCECHSMAQYIQQRNSMDISWSWESVSVDSNTLSWNMEGTHAVSISPTEP